MQVFKLVKDNQAPKTLFRGGAGRELMLIIYDTEGVDQISRGRLQQLVEKQLPEGIVEVRAKYALCLSRSDDSDLIAQHFATRGGADEAEWADDWHDLPNAIERLRLRHPDTPFPEEIGVIIDWPYNRGFQRPSKMA